MFKLPQFKGHVKIYTKNKKGRITQFYEGDNIVTNAVRDILANDYLGVLDPNLMTPLWQKWYGGILLYAAPHPNLDPDDYWVKNSNDQYCLGHAGHENSSDRNDDLYRGSYNNAKEIRTKNSVTQCFEWGHDRGGTSGSMSINAISLCNETLGNAGTGNGSQAFKNFFPFEILSNRLTGFTAGLTKADNIFFMTDDSHVCWFEMGQPGEYYNMHSRFETHYLTIYIKKIAIQKVGITDSSHVNPDFTDQFTLDLVGNIYCQPAYCFVDGYLWIFSNITGVGEDGHANEDLQYDQTIKWWKIDLSAKAIVDSGSWYNSSGESVTNRHLGPVCIEARGAYDSIAPFSVGTRSMNPAIPYCIDFVGKQFYFPVCNSPSIGGTSVAPKFNVEGTLAYSPDYNAFTIDCSYLDVQQEFMNSMSSDRYKSVIVMPGRVQNASTFYTCQSDPLSIDDRHVYIENPGSWVFATPFKASSYVLPIGCWGDWANAPRYLVANKFLNTTKLNLPSTLNKSAGESLTIEYTLTEI